MKKRFIVLIVISLIILIGILSIVGSYNGLVRQDEQVKNMLSQIDNQLQRRNDLIPNLVETVKGIADLEKEIVDSVTEARTKMSGAQSVEDRALADEELTSALSRLLVVVENYPDIKSNENFTQLADELAGTENRIAIARMDYNEAAREYNTKIRRFPTVFLANLLGFDSYPYFEAQESAREVPQVDFSDE